MKEAIPSYSWKQKDGKCKQNPWKETAEELTILNSKENSSEQLFQVYLYIAASPFRQLFYNICSLGIYLL